MDGFFKKTLSFLGLLDEDEINLENIEEKDSIKVINRKSKRESNKIESIRGKEDLNSKPVSILKQPRRSHFIGAGKDSTKSRLFIAKPEEFEEIQVIADNFKSNIPVIINLQETNQDLAKRIIDFCSGLTYALEGNIKKVAEKVFLISPYNVEISSEDKELLREEGLYDQF